ncbi:unnamed protein product [Heterobilharzia americana]|nr:unnamed protein product [Heterobilharzia americana]
MPMVGTLMSSRRSSESSGSVDSEVILEAERLELERLALKELELSISKPVAFSVRTNISFDGGLYGLDAPSPTRVVSFSVKDFLHIKKRFNQDWWIGRVVRIGSPIGFIPSPSKLEVINNMISPANTNVVHFASEIQNPTGKSVAVGGFGSADTTLERGGNRGLLLANDVDHRGPILGGNRQRQSESPPGHKNWKDTDGYDDDDLREGPQTTEVSGQTNTKKPQPIGPGVKKKAFSKKMN